MTKDALPMDTRKPIAHAGQFWRLKNGEIAYISSISDAQTASPISGRRIAADTYEMWAAATHLGAQQKERPRDSRYNVSRKPDGFALPMVSGTVDQLEHFAHAVLRHSLGN